MVHGIHQFKSLHFEFTMVLIKPVSDQGQLKIDNFKYVLKKGTRKTNIENFFIVTQLEVYRIPLGSHIINFYTFQFSLELDYFFLYLESC